MKTHLSRIRMALLCSVLGMANGCGDDSGDGATPTVIATPTPSPSATPTTTPSTTPSPSPSPSPSSTGTPTPSVPPLALANVGETLRGPLACGQAGRLTFALTPPALLRIESLASVFQAGDIDIAYKAADTYELSIGGTVAATRPDPSIKRPSVGGVYDYFQKDSGEFEVYRNATADRLTNVTLGRVSDQSRVCFFAVGGPAAYVRPASVSTRDFGGFADGVATDDTGTNFRLFQSPATARVDYTSGRVDIRMELRGRELAFNGFTDQPVAGSQVATGSATLGADGVFEGTLTTPQGFTGTVRGRLHGASPTGMTLAFAMRKSTVEFAIGSAGLDAR